MAQFTQLRKNVANYLETVRMEKAQTIALPLPVDMSTADVEDQKIIQEEAIRGIMKRKSKLDGALKKGYTTIWDQCSQEVRDKLEASNNWDRIQWEQSLHNLIAKIERIYISFDDHKQEIFNLVQALKTLFPHTQGGRESVKEYSRNFKSLWDTVEAFGGSPGRQKVLISGLLKLPGRVRDSDNVMAKEFEAAEDEVTKAVKAALLISGANKARYLRLKEQLATNYLLGTSQYPNTFKKATMILGNYQRAKSSQPEGDQRNKGGGLEFIQRGARGQGRGAGRSAVSGGRSNGSQDAVMSDAGGRGKDTSVSTLSTQSRAQTNSAGESHCFHCGKNDHWAIECPLLFTEQQDQLHMTLEAQEGVEQEEDTAHQFFHFSMLQAEELLDDQAYLDDCSTAMAFKTKKYLDNLWRVDQGVKINCNLGAMRTNEVGDFVGHQFNSPNAWYIPKGIVNIFSMNELEKRYHITYDSWQGYYVVHTNNGEVRFYKDENGLPYINREDLPEDTAALLVQAGSKEVAKVLVQTVQQNYEGYTKRKVLEAKEARRAIGMIGNPSEEDFKGMVRGNMIKNCPVTPDAITNARAIFDPNLPSLRGKTVWKTPAPVVSDYVLVPKEVVEWI
jgi:hypothetical protein